jgi:DNA-dependent RNA polymerase auxiliary subunit epsilon
MSIDLSDEWKNASDSIRFNLEFDSNAIDESNLQYEKQDGPRISTFRGIEIDSSDEHRNVSDSIRFNREFDSNEIDESD